MDCPPVGSGGGLASERGAGYFDGRWPMSAPAKAPGGTPSPAVSGSARKVAMLPFAEGD